MNSAKLPPVTKKFTDESTAEYFQFTFYCDECGTGRQTAEYPFSAAGKVKNLQDLTPLQKLIYTAEYEDAYERANREAVGYYTACEDNGKYICEDCILYR